MVHYINSYPSYTGGAYESIEEAKRETNINANGMIKRTISGETGKLIAVELVKD